MAQLLTLVHSKHWVANFLVTMNPSKALLRIQQPKMSLWYSTLSMGSFIDGDGNIIRWKHIEELQNIQEQEGLNLANKLSSNHIQFQLLCCRCDWASCIFNKFSKGTYVFTTLQCHSESLIRVVCVHIQFERKKCFISPIYRSNTRMKSYDSYCIEWKCNRLPP
jgi:hypothetical protein